MHLIIIKSLCIAQGTINKVKKGQSAWTEGWLVLPGSRVQDQKALTMSSQTSEFRRKQITTRR